jgi:hypothetical protein
MLQLKHIRCIKNIYISVFYSILYIRNVCLYLGTLIKQNFKKVVRNISVVLRHIINTQRMNNCKYVLINKKQIILVYIYCLLHLKEIKNDLFLA